MPSLKWVYILLVAALLQIGLCMPVREASTVSDVRVPESVPASGSLEHLVAKRDLVFLEDDDIPVAHLAKRSQQDNVAPPAQDDPATVGLSDAARAHYNTMRQDFHNRVAMEEGLKGEPVVGDHRESLADDAAKAVTNLDKTDNDRLAAAHQFRKIEAPRMFRVGNTISKVFDSAKGIPDGYVPPK